MKWLTVLFFSCTFFLSCSESDNVGESQDGFAPSELEANQLTEGGIELTWKDNSNFETGFLVEKSTNFNKYQQIADLIPEVISLTDNNISYPNFYIYRVRAYSNNDTSIYSNQDTIITVPIPSFGDLENLSEDSVKINWSSNEFSSNDVTEFLLERSNDDTNFISIGKFEIDSPTHIESSLDISKKYFYKVSNIGEYSFVSSNSLGIEFDNFSYRNNWVKTVSENFNKLSFSQDGNYLVLGQIGAEKIKVFNAGTGEFLWEKVFSDFVSEFEISSTSSIIFVSSNSNSLNSYVSSINLENGSVNWTNQYTKALDLELSGNDSLLYIVDTDSIREFSTGGGQATSLRIPHQFVNKIKLSNNNSKIISIGGDGFTRFWDLEIKEELWSYANSNSNIYSFALSDDDSLVALAKSSTIILVNANSGDIIWESSIIGSGSINNLVFSNDLQNIFVSKNDIIYKKSILSGETLLSRELTSSINNFVLNSDGTNIALALQNGVLSIINSESFSDIWSEVDSRFLTSYSVTFHPNGSRITFTHYNFISSWKSGKWIMRE